MEQIKESRAVINQRASAPLESEAEQKLRGLLGSYYYFLYLHSLIHPQPQNKKFTAELEFKQQLYDKALP